MSESSCQYPEIQSQGNILYRSAKAVEQNGSFCPLRPCDLLFFSPLERRSPLKERLGPILKALTHEINSHLRFALINDLSDVILSFFNIVDKCVYVYIHHTYTVGVYMYIYVPLFDRSKKMQLNI